ncbi:MAG: hypothetical protein JWQ40_5062 [Segetibacter sp.]|nr:hypothetical protein [Segetibacter sp.]
MTQQFYCVMIPDFVRFIGSPWLLLPSGIHDSNLEEVFNRYVFNCGRREKFEGLVRALDNLFRSGCPQIFLDGSYVTAKPIPNDYEVCWDIRFVNPDLLDPVFSDFSNDRQKQKEKYGGEFFPAQIKEGMSGKPFLEFFQTDKHTGKKKGIVRILNHLT